MIHGWTEPVWRALVARGELPPQPLLLTGPKGVGKSEFAQTVAQWLLCQQPSPSGGCTACLACRLVQGGNHPDFRVLQPGGTDDEADPAEGAEPRAGKRLARSRWIKVEQVRELGDFIFLAPHYGQRKAVLILEAERLHPSAANALLKTLEEPPPGRHFLLVTHRPQSVLATVRSRCVRLQFQLPPVESALTWLAAQGARDPSAALAWAGGAPLHALAAEAPEHVKVREWLVERFLGTPDSDPVELGAEVDAETLPIVVASLQRWCHDLTLVRLAGSPRYYPGCAQILHRAAALADLSRLLGFAREIQSTVRLLEHPLNPRLVAESCLIGYRNLFAASR